MILADFGLTGPEAANRITVSETDTGKELKQNVADLEELLDAYHKGLIKESR